MNKQSIVTPRASRFTRRQVLAASAATGAALALKRPALAQTPVPALWPDAASIPTNLAADASPRFRAVAEAAMEAMSSIACPGLALGIFADGVEEHAVFGVTNLETMEPVTNDSLFQVGSISKTFTGTAIMRLVAQGKLDLYAPVRQYLPDFDVQDGSVAARVTVHHLLTHTAGWWGDAFFETGDGDDAVARYIQEIMPALPQLFPPGMCPSYNNAAIVTLGRLIEVATGQDYRSAMQELILDPVGLSASTYDPARVESGSYALGYTDSPAGTVPQTPLNFPRGIDPAGGLWSNTRDQLRYARFHIDNGATQSGDRLLPAYTAELMRTPQARFVEISNIAVGLTWFLQELNGVHLATHDGHTFGQHSSLMIAPDEGFAIIMLSNIETGGGGADPAVLQTAAKKYLGFGEEAVQLGMSGGPIYTPDPEPLMLSEEQLAEYAGRYGTPDLVLTLRVEKGQLLVTFENPEVPDLIHGAVVAPPNKDVPLSVVSGERLVIGDYQLGAIVRKPDASIGWLRLNILTLPRLGAE